jgi:hypothetical protein
VAPEVNGVCRGRGLAVLYALPSALTAKLPKNKPLSLDAGFPVTIKMTPQDNLYTLSDRLSVTAQNDMRSWVTFPLTQLPLYAKYSKGELTVCIPQEAGLSSTLYPYDELHYLRGERFQVRDGELWSEDLYTTWTSYEARVDGVLETWFEWTPSKRRLEAWVLTTGGGFSSGDPVRPEEWPAEAPWRAEFEGRHMVVTRKSWILENL